VRDLELVVVVHAAWWTAVAKRGNRQAASCFRVLPAATAAFTQPGLGSRPDKVRVPSLYFAGDARLIALAAEAFGFEVTRPLAAVAVAVAPPARRTTPAADPPPTPRPAASVSNLCIGLAFEDFNFGIQPCEYHCHSPLVSWLLKPAR
jgi:hypothetical protein